MSEAGCWPEQDAVDKWFDKYAPIVPFDKRMELKNAVSKFRIRVEHERDLYHLLVKDIDKEIADLVDQIVRENWPLGKAAEVSADLRKKLAIHLELEDGTECDITVRGTSQDLERLMARLRFGENAAKELQKIYIDEPLPNEKAYDDATKILNNLLDAGGADENHVFAKLVAQLGRLIENYENKNSISNNAGEPNGS